MHGDANTHFFHQFANGRRRKNTIARLEDESGEIRGQKGLTEHIMHFYKQLFGHNEPCSIQLSKDFWPVSLQLSENDKAELIRDFSMQEIKEVVFDMKSNSAPGPNGFGVIFFKNHWESIKDDIFSMFIDFSRELLDIKRLNFGVTTLIPKVQEANTIRQFKPICLLNVDYKIFTKVLTNRLVPIADKVIGRNQTGFIKGRNIFEGVIILHEVLHELKRSKSKGLILKIDFEKAYDRVRWSFLE